MTENELIALADKADLDLERNDDGTLYGMVSRNSIESLYLFAELVAAAEREACAKLCDDMVLYTGFDCARAIRARGQ